MSSEVSRAATAALATYTLFSVSYFAIQWHRLHGTLFPAPLDDLSLPRSLTFRAYIGQLWAALNLMHSASWPSVAALLNLLVNSLILSTLAIKQSFLGELSLMETHKLLEFVIGYLSFKFMLLLALVDVLPAKPLWFVWFLAVSCVKVLGLLAKERCHRLSTSPTASLNSHLRTFSLLVLILAINAMLAICLLMATSWNEIPIALLLLYEPLVIACDSTQSVFQYSLHIVEAHPELLQPRKLEKPHEWVPSSESSEWQELRTWLMYNSSFLGEGSATLLTILHCCLVWLVRGFSFSVVDVVLFLNIRAHAIALSRRVWAFTRWHSVLSSLRAAFPDATSQQLIDFADDCAICRDTLSSAKRLPCGHIFHLSCLRSWFEQSSHTPCTCPTCRRPLEGLSPSSFTTATSVNRPRENPPPTLLSLLTRVVAPRWSHPPQQGIAGDATAAVGVADGGRGAPVPNHATTPGSPPQPHALLPPAAASLASTGMQGQDALDDPAALDGTPYQEGQQQQQREGSSVRLPFSLSLQGLRFRGSRPRGQVLPADASAGGGQAEINSAGSGSGGLGGGSGGSRGGSGTADGTGSGSVIWGAPGGSGHSNYMVSTGSGSGRDRLAQMTERVAEVLPHVPLAVITEVRVGSTMGAPVHACTHMSSEPVVSYVPYICGSCCLRRLFWRDGAPSFSPIQSFSNPAHSSPCIPSLVLCRTCSEPIQFF